MVYFSQRGKWGLEAPLATTYRSTRGTGKRSVCCADRALVVLFVLVPWPANFSWYLGVILEPHQVVGVNLEAIGYSDQDLIRASSDGATFLGQLTQRGREALRHFGETTDHRASRDVRLCEPAARYVLYPDFSSVD